MLFVIKTLLKINDFHHYHSHLNFCKFYEYYLLHGLQSLIFNTFFWSSNFYCFRHLISHCIDLLKSCHVLTEQLVAHTMESSGTIKSPTEMDKIVTAAKEIRPRWCTVKASCTFLDGLDFLAFETGNFSHAKQFRSKQKKLTVSNNISRNVHKTCTLVLVLLCMKHHKRAKVLCMHWPFTSELLSVAYFR